MKWVIGIAVLLVVTVVTIWIVGRFLPLAHRATAARSVPASAEQVWTRIANVDRWDAWRPDVKSVTRLSDDTVQVADKFGSARYRIEWPEERTLVTVIDQEGLPYGGRWIWVVEPRGSNVSVVTITEEGEIYNPIFRFLARFVFGYDATMRSVLDQLETSFESTTT